MTEESHMNTAHSGQPVDPASNHHIPYFRTFGLLIVLTCITVLAYYLLLWGGIRNEAVRVLIALVIASAKAALVAAFFMHLKFEGRMVHLILYVPLLLCVLLVVALIPDILNGPLFNPPQFHSSHEASDTAPAPAHDSDEPAH
jgi:cytochrome c oxidase subunit 4